MKQDTRLGIIYSNERLQISEDEYPLNSVFFKKGKEIQITPDVWQIGYCTPSSQRDESPPVIIKDSQGVIFISQERLKKIRKEKE
jgi:hypothetical protein